MDFVKKYDKLVSLAVVILIMLFVFILSRSFFLDFNSANPIFGGFIKFFILASFGDFVSYRLRNKIWGIPKNILIKAIIWGIIGIVIVYMFKIFPAGVAALQDQSLLPFRGSELGTAFLISLFMNVIFAPTMMAFHKISDTYLDLEDKKVNPVKEVDWVHFYKFVILKTIPLFWIPAHTITFILPGEYRIIFAAVLGIMLGLLLTIFKK
jgi:hypothetical protein